MRQTTDHPGPPTTVTGAGRPQTTGRLSEKVYYPLFVDLNGRRCVVVGGGMVAQRKVTTLLKFGAQVTVVSPTATKQLQVSTRTGKIRWLARRFRPVDLRGAWLAYAATDDQTINKLVSRTANVWRIFTNVVDQKPLCSFIAPALFTRGPLTIAISTGGASPTIAKRLRRELERTIGAEYLPMLRLLTNLRAVAKRKLPSYNYRKRYFDHVVRGRVFQLVRSHHPREAKQIALALLERYARENGR